MTQAYIIIDMQNDFIDGSLGTPEAQAIVPHVEAKIVASKKDTDQETDLIFTQDTHDSDYLETREGSETPHRPLHQGYAGLAHLQTASALHADGRDF